MIESLPKNQSNNRIKKLPPLLVNQLAAGEVVTRPASVVKELIENAIDADAKSIDIRITQGGMGIIEVVDDGFGIHPDDMVMAVTRFATSKIADVANLQGIATLGFRGEALAATAAVSRLSLKSCPDNKGIGRELNVAGILNDTPELRPVVHPRGTTVTVKDLYFNVPARRGNLKSISAEYAQIEMIVKHLALVASDVSFSLWHNDKRRFNLQAVQSTNSNAHSSSHDAPKSLSLPSSLHPPVTSSSNSLEPSLMDQPSSDRMTTPSKTKSGKPCINTPLMQATLQRLQSVLPASQLQSSLFESSSLQPINIDLDGLVSADQVFGTDEERIGIYGFLIPSQNLPANMGYKLIYINGRLVKDRRISQCLRECSKHLNSHLNSHLDPNSQAELGYVLFFELPKTWLNLNVHPSKQCIKIQNLANIMAHLETGIRDALSQWESRQPTNERHPSDLSGSSTFQASSNSKSIALNSNVSLKGNSRSSKVRVNEQVAGYAIESKGAPPKEAYFANWQNSENSKSFIADANEPNKPFDLNKAEMNKAEMKKVSFHLFDIECLAIVTSGACADGGTSSDLKVNLADSSDNNRVLVKLDQSIYLFQQFILIDSIQHTANKVITIEDYDKCVTDAEKVIWLNEGFKNIVEHLVEEDLRGWKENLIKKALNEISFSKLAEWMVKQTPN